MASEDPHDEFLSSWKGSMLGKRPSIGVPTRGLRGVAVIAGSVALVGGVVVGGVTAVQTMTQPDPDSGGTAALTSAGLATASPTTVEPTETPTATATKHPKKTKKTEEPAVRTSTRTVTATTEPTETATKTTKAKKTTKTATKVTAGIGVIKNLVTGYCADFTGLDSVGVNTPLLQTNCFPGSSDNQMFQTVTQADGTFMFRNIKSQLCLDVGASGAVSAGTKVVAYTCYFGGTDNQMYRKKAQGDGFWLVNVKSNLCLDPTGTDSATTEVDTGLVLNTCSTDDNMIWTFEK